MTGGTSIGFDGDVAVRLARAILNARKWTGLRKGDQVRLESRRSGVYDDIHVEIVRARGGRVHIKHLVVRERRRRSAKL